MRKKLNWVSNAIATAVASSMVIGSAVVAQSSSSASSPTFNDRTSSGVVGGPASSPRQSQMPVQPEPTPAATAPAATSSTGSASTANVRSRSGVVTSADSSTGDDSGSRGTRHAARSDRN